MLSRFDNEQFAELRKLVGNSKNIVITTHHNPDGDAIGSVLGLYHGFKQVGVESRMVTPNGFPEFIGWMPGAEQIVRYSEKKELAAELLGNADIIFCLDFNGFRRTETLEAVISKATGKKVLIDHHPNPENFFDIQFSRIQVSSTAELVYEVLTGCYGSNALNADVALSLFVGIMTDTGSFSYGCSWGNTFHVAGELIARGVSVEWVQGLVYNNFSVSRMRLVGYSLHQKMRVFPEHRAAYISLTRDELKQFDYKMGDTEGLVNYPLSIKGIVFSVLFVEHDTFVKVSLRSRGSFPVNLFSQKHFNGGGHTNAAGGKSFVSLTETETLFERLLGSYTNELNIAE